MSLPNYDFKPRKSEHHKNIYFLNIRFSVTPNQRSIINLRIMHSNTSLPHYIHWHAAWAAAQSCSITSLMPQWWCLFSIPFGICRQEFHTLHSAAQFLKELASKMSCIWWSRDTCDASGQPILQQMDWKTNVLMCNVPTHRQVARKNWGYTLSGHILAVVLTVCVCGEEMLTAMLCVLCRCL